MNRRDLIGALSLSCAALVGRATHAQNAGARPLTIMIPFAPGGSSDIVVRAISEPMAQELGRPVVIENKGGAGGLIASAAVARAAADGGTLLYGNQAQFVIAPHLFAGTGHDPRSSLAPITLTARTQFFLVVPADSPLQTAAALVQVGRRGLLRFGTSGIGSSPHLAAALLAESAGIAIEAIPYQGSAPMLVDLMAARLDAAFDNVATSLPHLRGGKLRALGVSSPRRIDIAPDVPTLAEAGVAGYAYQAWQGLFAPSGTPDAAIRSLSDAVQRALSMPAIAARLRELGLDAGGGSSAEFAALIARDAEHWTDMVRRGVIRAS